MTCRKFKMRAKDRKYAILYQANAARAAAAARKCVEHAQREIDPGAYEVLMICAAEYQEISASYAKRARVWMGVYA